MSKNVTVCDTTSLTKKSFFVPYFPHILMISWRTANEDSCESRFDRYLFVVLASHEKLFMEIGLSITIVGTIGIDTIETPFGRAEQILGGSATYCALAAAHFASVNLVAVAGSDIGDSLTTLDRPGIDMRGIEHGDGPNFRWGGRYHMDFNSRDTLFTELGVLATFAPKVPEPYRDADILFLANLQPTVQDSVFAQMQKPRLTALDTMNFWIESNRDDLAQVMSKVDVVIMAEDEVRQFAGTGNLRAAARQVFALGPKVLVVKLGSYGALMLDAAGTYFAAPGFPLDDVRDPTGAGDAFAGGFLGALAQVLATGRAITPTDFKRSLIYGNIMGAFTCEAFGVARLTEITNRDIAQRYAELIAFTHLDSGSASPEASR